MSQVTLLHSPPEGAWSSTRRGEWRRKNWIPGPLTKSKMATLKQVLLLQAASFGPCWVMSPLCWTTTSYQVSHKGSFIKLDSPLVFIALIKGHKRPFFSAFWCWIINSINWTQLSSQIQKSLYQRGNSQPQAKKKKVDLLLPVGIPGPWANWASTVLTSAFSPSLVTLPLC